MILYFHAFSQDNTLATSQGGSEYTLDSTQKQYEGYREEDFAEERRSDTDLFLNEQSNWMDDDESSRNPLTWQPHLPEVTRQFSDMKVQNETVKGNLLQDLCLFYILSKCAKGGQGGSEYTFEVTQQQYKGYLEEARKSDTNLFLDGQSNRMDRDDESSTNPMDWDCHFPELKKK